MADIPHHMNNEQSKLWAAIVIAEREIALNMAILAFSKLKLEKMK